MKIKTWEDGEAESSDGIVLMKWKLSCLERFFVKLCRHTLSAVVLFCGVYVCGCMFISSAVLESPAQN